MDAGVSEWTRRRISPPTSERVNRFTTGFSVSTHSGPHSGALFLSLPDVRPILRCRSRLGRFAGDTIAAMSRVWRVGILGLGHWYSAFALARALREYPDAVLVAAAWDRPA